MFDSFQRLDSQIFRFINARLVNPFFDRLMPFASDPPFFYPVVLIAFAVTAWKATARGRLCLFFLATALCLGDPLITNSIKKSIDRHRPYVTMPETKLRVGKTDNPSMPSGHASNWFAATVVVAMYYRRRALLMLPIALTVAYSRIYNGVHYPSDVLAGSMLGAFYGFALVTISERLWQWAGPAWFPTWHRRLPSLLEFHDAGPEKSAAMSIEWERFGYCLIAVLLAGRWLFLATNRIQLSEDEAYYWLWSKHLALSYYSKPPLIALTIKLGTWIAGDHGIGVRFFAPLLTAITSAALLRFLIRQIEPRWAVLSVGMLAAAPILCAGALLMTIDPLSVTFWTFAMLAGWRAIQADAGTKEWAWVGLFFGLGMLSKYTALFQLLSFAMLFLVDRQARVQCRRAGPYLALGIGALMTIPVIIWNAQNGWPTVTHVASDAHLGEPWQFTLRYFWDFALAEIFLLNPFFCVGIILALLSLLRFRNRSRLAVYFFCMGFPISFFYLAYTFHSRVMPNWIAPAVVPLLMLLLLQAKEWHAVWPRFTRRILGFAIGFGIITTVFIHDTNLLTKITKRSLPTTIDPLRRVRGWQDSAEMLEKERKLLETSGRPVFVLTEHYGIASLLSFYDPTARAALESVPLVYCLSSKTPENQFYFWPSYEAPRVGQDAVFIRVLKPELAQNWFSKWWRKENALETHPEPGAPPPGQLVQQFESVEPLEIQDVLYKGSVIHRLQLFHCRKLKDNGPTPVPHP